MLLRRGLLPSQDPQMYQFVLIRGWEDSATMLIEGIHTLRVLCTLPGHCQQPGPTWGRKLPTVPGHGNPALGLCWKLHVGTPWNQNPESKSCQIWWKLNLMRALLRRPFSSKLPKKKPAVFLSFLLTVEPYFSLKWSPWLTIFGTQFVTVGSGARKGEEYWGASA